MVDQPASPLIEPLTEREQEILALVVQGHSNNEIAQRLHLALKTVKWYNTQIYEKLDVTNRKQAAERATALGLLVNAAAQQSRRTNLLKQATPFIGRERELADLAQLIADESVSLITIIAPGGMGKTRLAIEAAQRHTLVFVDGVYMVPLAPLHNPDNLVPTIAELIGFYFYQTALTAEEQLLDFLSRQHMLLVLDNFEHLMDGAPLLMRMIQAAPNLKLIVTSRERLNLSGETTFALGGLTYNEHSSVLGQSEALALFMQCASRIHPDFFLDPNNRADIEEICRLVQGMPLGIELAAGWLDTLPIPTIIQEIRQGIDILETELRDMPERHRSIRAMFNGTWDRLNDQERAALAALSVFRGRFDTQSAEAIAQTSIRILRRLVNKALLQTDIDGFYALHELLRQYSYERLQESGQMDAVRTRHMHYFADFMERQWTLLDSFDRHANRAIEAELENVIAAWCYAIKTQSFPALSKINRPLAWFMGKSGRGDEAIVFFTDALEALKPLRGEPEAEHIYGHLMLQTAYLYIGIDAVKFIQLILEGIDILKQVNAVDEMIWGLILLVEHRYLPVEAYWPRPPAEILQEAYQLALQTGDIYYQGIALAVEAEMCIETGHKDKALTLLEAAIARWQQGANLPTPQFQLHSRAGYIYHELRLYDEALAHYEQALIMAETTEYLYSVAHIRTMIGRIYVARGEVEAARKQIASVLHWHQRIARDWQILGALYGAVAEHLLIPTGELEQAVEILSFVHHHPLVVRDMRESTRFLMGTLEPQLSPEVYRAAVARGKQLELHQLVNELLRQFST
ncbi:MAG: BTAD domain-containing putative transcriptional regulator [Anaerolineae bacterium]